MTEVRRGWSFMAGMPTQTQNPKTEGRKNTEIRKPKGRASPHLEVSKPTKARGRGRTCCGERFWISAIGPLSDFQFRISNLGRGYCAWFIGASKFPLRRTAWQYDGHV